MIKKTSLENPNDIVSAYKDNVAFVKGPRSNLPKKRRQTWFLSSNRIWFGYFLKSRNT
jgi:hypothetical protein